MKVRLSYDHPHRRGCYGLQMEDGTRYTVSRAGTIDVERKDHLKAIAANGNVDISTNMPTGFQDVDDDGKWCSTCNFHGWRFQIECPRCGGEMADYATDDAE